MQAWRRWLTAGVAALVLTAGSCSSPPPATPHQAAPTQGSSRSQDTELPLQTYGSMLVDPVHSHVFVTGGVGDPLVVVDYAGAVVAALPAESGGGLMYLDGTTLWLTRPFYGLLDALDTSTLRLTRSYPTAPIVSPSSVTKAAGRIWISNRAPLEPGLESLDPLTGVTEIQHLEGGPANGVLSTSPADAGTIVLAENDGTPQIDLLDVSTGTATVKASAALAGGAGGQTMMGPGGTSFWVGDAVPSGVATYRTADLHPGPAPGLAALRPNGPTYATASAAAGLAYLPQSNRLAVGLPHSQGSEIQLFGLGASRPSAVYPVGGQLSFDGIRAAPDKPQLFVVHSVVTGQGSTPPHFQVVDTTAAPAAVVNDFGLMVFPFSAATVIQGQSTSLTIAVGVASGNYEPVTFTAHGLPPGVTALFTPPSGVDRSTLTLTAAADAAPGPATVTVTAMNLSASHSTALALSVTAGTDFAISAYQSNLDVVQGQSTTTALYAVGPSGTTGTVTWSAANLPAGVTATFTPPTAVLGTTSNLTLTALGPGPGDAVSTPVTVTGTSPLGTHTLALSLTVTALPVDFWQSLTPPPTGATGAVSVASRPSGRLDLFARGADSSLWHRFEVPGAVWSPWENLGGQLTSDPAAVSWADGRIDVFARGIDDQLWHQWWDGTRWQGWEPRGGVLTSAPAVASWSAGRLDVVVRGTDQATYHTFWGGAWSGWERRGGDCSGDPGAASPAPGVLDIFCLGGPSAPGQLLHEHWQGGWSAWVRDVPGTLTAGVAATSATPGRVDVFGLDKATQALGHDWFDGIRWNQETLDGALVSSPAAAAGPLGRINVLGLGANGQIHQRIVG